MKFRKLLSVSKFFTFICSVNDANFFNVEPLIIVAQPAASEVPVEVTDEFSEIRKSVPFVRIFFILICLTPLYL